MNRRILVSLMVIGIVGAVAGSGTLAYFNDTESVTGNTFAAGALDLKIGWTEHYNAPATEETPFEIQEVTDNPGPVFNFSDLKPGDYGEATINLDLQTNPGWVWFRLQQDADSDNGCNDPELEAEPNCGQDGDGEIDDHFSHVVWYDDGDNVFEDGEEKITTTTQTCSEVPVDLALVLDRSGSMDGAGTQGENPPPQDPGKFDAAQDGAYALVNSLGSNDQGALVTFADSATLDEPLTGDKQALNDSIAAVVPEGGTNLGSGIDTAHSELTGPDSNSGAEKVMVVLSDGNSKSGPDPETEAQQAIGDGVRIITVAYEGAEFNTTTLENVASSPSDAYLANQSNVEQIFSDLRSQICDTEEVDLSDGVRLDGDPSTEEIDPYQPGESHIGFKWNFTKDAGNEAQTDSLVYDMEFYTQQARNNPNPQNPWTQS